MAIWGKDNARKINEKHPGLPKAAIKRLHGLGDVWVAETRLTYGDGSVWDAVNIFEFKDGKIVRQTDYFGAPLPAPAWRAQLGREDGLRDVGATFHGGLLPPNSVS